MTRRSKPPVLRINARLDPSYAEKLEFLQAATRHTVSDIVRDSVDRYYEAVKAEQRRKRAGLDRLVGAFEGGPADGSVNYERDFADSVQEKHLRDKHLPERKAPAGKRPLE